jgi:hypothetical protein
VLVCVVVCPAESEFALWLDAIAAGGSICDTCHCKLLTCEHHAVLVCFAVCPAESEFALWLEAIAAGGSYQQLSEALRLLAHELNHLKPKTLELVAGFFRYVFRCVCVWGGG